MTSTVQTPQLVRGRKSVAFNDTITVASPLRRGNLKLTTSTVNDQINDEAERSQRRSDAHLQKRLSNISAGSQGPRTVTAEKECKEHVMAVLKLFAENKICQKNVWNLKIIDYMRSIFTHFGDQSLQIATSSLDASTKIYALRVDDVHSEGLKLASSLARIKGGEEKETPDDGDIPEGEGGEGDANQKQQNKRKKKKFVRGVKHTIAKDVKSIITDFPKLESASYQSKIDEDNCGVTQLFTTSLPMDYCGFTHLLCHEKPFTYKDPIVKVDKKGSFEVKPEKIQICPQFSGFAIDEWDPDNEQELNEEEPVDKPVLFDNNGLPIPELDGSFHNCFAEINDNDDSHSDREEYQARSENLQNVTNFRPSMNVGVEENDYTYYNTLHMSDKFTSLVWAGPSHWKLKNIHRLTARFTGKDVKQPKMRRTKAVVEGLNMEEELELLDFTQQYIPKKTVLRSDPDKNILPPYVFTNSFNKPFLLSREIPHDFPFYREKTNNQGLEYEGRPYDYDNPNDSQYCIKSTQDDGNDFMDDNDHHDNTLEEIDIVHQENRLFDNLVDVPEIVQKTNIKYALQPKRIDMKKLKSTIWKSVVCDDKELYEDIDEANIQNKPAKPHTFLEIMSKLPERLNEKMRGELSKPLAFVALLHLANEHNLKLTSTSLKDFTIEQDHDQRN